MGTAYLIHRKKIKIQKSAHSQSNDIFSSDILVREVDLGAAAAAVAAVAAAAAAAAAAAETVARVSAAVAAAGAGPTGPQTAAGVSARA